MTPQPLFDPLQSMGNHKDYEGVAHSQSACTTTTIGCTNPRGINYNPLATREDSTCYVATENTDPEYETCCWIPGCTHRVSQGQYTGNLEFAVNPTDTRNFYYYDWVTKSRDWEVENYNYDPQATFAPSHDTCVAHEKGCNNPAAVNYNSLAEDPWHEACWINDADGHVITDGNRHPSCCLLLGCTDPDCSNFDVHATADDGSCILNLVDTTESNKTCLHHPMAVMVNEQLQRRDDGDDGVDGMTTVDEMQRYGRGHHLVYCEIIGCTDHHSTNYDPDASVDSGDCYEGCTHPRAINFDTSTPYNPNCDSGILNGAGPNNLPVGLPGDTDCPDPHQRNSFGEKKCYIMGCTSQYMPHPTMPGVLMLNSNYDVAATFDDGSCHSVELGCINPRALNWDRYAKYDNPYNPCMVLGCMDPRAANYDQEATYDVACEYAVPSYGCMHPRAVNYDQLADIDDGGCFILGCTEVNATNYDKEANVDDNSCYKDHVPAQIEQTKEIYDEIKESGPRMIYGMEILVGFGVACLMVVILCAACIGGCIARGSRKVSPAGSSPA